MITESTISSTVTYSHMPLAEDMLAKSIGRHDRRHGHSPRHAPRDTHHGTIDAPGDITAAHYAVRLLVYPAGTRDIDCANARPVHTRDIARFFERGAAVAYACWLATQAGKHDKPHAYDVYEGGRKIYRAG